MSSGICCFDYVFQVTTKKIYIYTIIQLVCLAILLVIKLIAVVAPSFPFFIICLIPLRKSLVKLFSQQDLEEVCVPYQIFLCTTLYNNLEF